ncbi:MAG: cyclase family protein [Candidatus Marinimicrobia bacterium]|nr:cyclase family protein [Candidatus Neomarinimicrobiota bacterium]
MHCSIEIDNRLYQYNTDHFHDLSIPMNFNGDQANYFDVKRASTKPFQNENVIGDTKQGGGCNFDVVSFIPHCNGTHTECVGHIVDEDIHVNAIINDALFPATFITVKPESNIIDADQIHVEAGFNAALIVRTLPNSDAKLSATYNENNQPPYFSRKAMKKINELGIRHLSVDMPTIDPAYDDGKLTNHHTFWNVEQGGHSLNGKPPSFKTITEMIYVPNDISDGSYLLQIQVTNFVSDAAPSRPLIFPLELS